MTMTNAQAALIAASSNVAIDNEQEITGLALRLKGWLDTIDAQTLRERQQAGVYGITQGGER